MSGAGRPAAIVRQRGKKGIEIALRRELILAGVLLPVLLLVTAFAEESDESLGGLLGDESDGSRAHPTHLIPLYPENEDGERGEQVTPEAELVLPFSTKWTCGECHSYDLIKQGWHFNAVDSNVPPGRYGEPWVYFDAKLGIQVPLSYRAWPGTHQPAAFGMTEFRFTQIFGRHMPGGGPGEVTATDVDDIGRQYVAGKLEINCLTCHNGHYGQDQGGVGGYAVQVSRQNFRWAAAASCEFASVKGSASAMMDTYDPFMPMGDDKEPQVVYREGTFDADGSVLFDIVRETPNQRCYYCHSDVYYAEKDGPTEKWSCDEDIHLTAGLKCVDCHRNGVGHNIIRGYTQESDLSGSSLAATTCEGCHLPEGSDVPEAGRLGAPVPEHVGLPPVHFERLTCTACHSGPWPGEGAVLTKTSRAHRLGTPNVNKAEAVLPHILSPVFAQEAGTVAGSGDTALVQRSGKIAPHKLIWPAYWATLVDGKVTPIKLDVVETTVKKVFEDLESPGDGSWPQMAEERLAEALKSLGEAVGEKAAYVAGGTLYHLGDAAEVVEEADHPAGAPYMWPLAHGVRPAAQSLGVRYCTDCHSTKSPFFFGAVGVDSPVASAAGGAKEQVEFQGISRFYAWAFSASFVFRPWFKIFALGSSAILGVVLLLYGLRALGGVARVLAEKE